MPGFKVRVEHADYHTFCTPAKAAVLVERGRAVRVNDGLIHMTPYVERPGFGGEWRSVDSSMPRRGKVVAGPKMPVRQWERLR